MQELLFIGKIIRQKRLESGQTQEELCAGLCDPATLSRIENGKQTPSRKVILALSQRLDLPLNRYYVLTPSEAEAAALQSKINYLAFQFPKLLGEEKHQTRLDALERLDKLESITEAGNPITRQYILAMRAFFGKETGPYSPEAKLDLLLEAIRLTAPQLDLEALGGRLYYIDETRIICQIAEAYSEAGQHEKATGIFRQLFECVQSHTQDVIHPAQHLSPVALSFARELCLTGHYSDALEIAELGRKACLEDEYYIPLAGLLAAIAECNYAMGEFKRSKDLFCQSYYLFKVTEHASGLAAVEKSAKEKMFSNFPL